MILAVLITLLLVGCTDTTTVPVVSSQDQTVAISQDATAVSADQTPAVVPAPLTLKEKLSVAAREFEPLKTSYMPFCSKTPKDLNLFYTTLFYEMIRHESGFNTNEDYYECAKAKCYYSAGCFTDPTRGFCRITSSKIDGGFAVSRGLFQLSVSSSRGLGCKFVNNSDDLHDPDINIKCAMLIAKNYIVQDKVIIGKIDDKWKGLSRFWAVVRPEFDGKPRNSYVKIDTAIKKIEGCN